MTTNERTALPVNWTTDGEAWPGHFICKQCACIFTAADIVGICDECGEAICPNCECGCEYDNVPAEQRIPPLDAWELGAEQIDIRP